MTKPIVAFRNVVKAANTKRMTKPERFLSLGFVTKRISSMMFVIINPGMAELLKTLYHDVLL